MSGGGRGVGVTGTLKHAKMLIGRTPAIESHIGACGAECLGGKTIQQVHGSVESLNPIASWKRSLEKQ